MGSDKLGDYIHQLLTCKLPRCPESVCAVPRRWKTRPLRHNNRVYVAYLLLGAPTLCVRFRSSGAHGNVYRLPMATEMTIGAIYARHASISSNDPGGAARLMRPGA